MANTRLLLLDNAEIDSSLLREKLESYDEFTTLHVSSLKEALGLIDKIDVLVVDLEASEETDEIIRLLERKHKPMIIMIGKAEFKLAYDAGIAGAFGGYLIKPVNKEQIVASVAWVLGLYRRFEKRMAFAKEILNGTHDKEI